MSRLTIRCKSLLRNPVLKNDNVKMWFHFFFQIRHDKFYFSITTCINAQYFSVSKERVKFNIFGFP